MRSSLVPLALLLPVGAACSGAAAEPVTARRAPAAAAPAAAPSPGPPAATAPPPAEGAGGGASGEGGAGPAAAADEKACPAGMKLVEGDYCTDVEHECLRSWFDPNNKKVVCEDFKPTARCKGDKVHKRYCVDTYEWPNKKGERPEVMNTFYQAQVKCAAAGKRMCTESEWTFACEGPEMKPFPYGYKRDPKKCNGDHPWDGPNMKLVGQRDPAELARLWKGVRSGSQPECVSDFGVADLPGNADEVSSSETLTGDWRGKFDSVNTGGPWYKGVRNQCRPKIYTHEEGFYYYYLSFRCCAEPDGQPTDPRTTRQRKTDRKFSWVEAQARFTVGQMKEKLALKEKGACTCPDKDILCKTMCGTLLGPGAVDATH